MRGTQRPTLKTGFCLAPLGSCRLGEKMCTNKAAVSLAVKQPIKLSKVPYLWAEASHPCPLGDGSPRKISAAVAGDDVASTFINLGPTKA